MRVRRILHDAWTIAAKDATEMWRDGRFSWASATLLVVLTVASSRSRVCSCRPVSWVSRRCSGPRRWAIGTTVGIMHGGRLMRTMATRDIGYAELDALYLELARERM